jgi:hypothetical protein
MKTTSVSLTDDELILLDGQCSPEVQDIVDVVRFAIRVAATGAAPEIARFVASAVAEAKQSGRLIFTHMGIRCCPVCGKDAGYAPHKRTSSRYKVKGQPNHDRPLTLGAWELADRFVFIQRHVTIGCCEACWVIAKPLLAAELKPIRAEVPEAITGHAPRFLKHDNVECTQCGWIGHEGEMGRARTLLGDGTYPASCPRCEAKNTAFGPVLVKTIDGFSIVEAPPTVRSNP